MLVAAWALVLTLGILRLQDDYWFEDDPSLYVSVTRIEGPHSAFFDPKAAAVLGAPNEFIPMAQLSYWLDAQIEYRSVKVAYLHSIVSFVLAAVAFFYLLTQVFGSVPAAAATAVLWTLLPSSVASVEYLSTRCYVEGFLFSCLALASVRKHWLLAGFFALLACLSKEFFPPVLLSALFLVGLRQGKFALVATSVGVGAIYAAMRIRMVGSGVDYGMPFLSPVEYVRFLAKLPYYFSGNWSGYFLFLAGLAILVISRKKPPRHPGLLPLLGALWVLAIATVFPISFALDSAWKGHGVWSRSGFVFNSIALVAFMTLVLRVDRRSVGSGVIALAFLILGNGTIRTERAWTVLKAHYRAEAEFALDGTTRALYSTVPASWFFRWFIFLHRDVGNLRARVILRHENLCEKPENLTANGEFWGYQNGMIVNINSQLPSLMADCR